MDKNREVRRGGVLGKRHVSATRRSRASTGFKYSPVVSNNEDGDEMVEKSPSPNPRLQENNKERTSKKHSGRMSPSLQEVSDCWRDPERERSQSKRKRMESQNHPSSSAKEMDDNSDDNTEIGRSEDDDDLPPPTVPRRPWKLKLHGKPREDLSPIDPAAVPRRLRTAMTKRQQESSSHSHVADIPKQRHSNDVGAAVMSTPTSSNLAVNPGRKKKSDNHKPPTAKLAKIASSKVSKTEVEVAETLYDLARMFTAQTMPSPPETNAEPIIAAKSGLATPATGRDMKQSPVVSNADAASPSSSLAQSQSGVMKRKRPWMSLKTKDEGLTSGTGPAEIGSVEQAFCLHSEKGQSATEPRESPKPGPSVTPVIGSTTTSPDIKAEVENLETPEAKSTRMEVRSPSVEIKSSSDVPEKLSMLNSGGPVDVANKDIKLEENLVTVEDTQKPDFENRSLEPAPKEDGSVNKFEIDLMVPPEGIDKADETLDSNIPNAQDKEQTLPDKGNGNLVSNMGNTKVKEEVNLAIVSSAEIITSSDKDRKKVDNSKNMEFDKESKQPTESLEPDESNDWKPEMDNGMVRERNNKVDASKDRSKQDMVKQMQRGTGNDAKPDSVAHKCDPNASAKITTTSDLKSTQLPVSMAGWPAGFPPIGYYSWPTPLPMTGMPSCENSRMPPQLPSFFFPPRQPRKRCATHVYITRFIDSHRHIKSNSLWAVAYGNPTAMYANSIMGPSVSSALEPGIRPHELSIPCLKVKEPTGAGPTSATAHGAKERANTSGADTLELKPSLQKQTQAAHKNPSLNDSVLGLPINTTSAPASGSSTGTPNTTGSNTLVTAAMFSGGSSVSSSPTVSSIRNGLLDGSGASLTPFHAQILNSVIQQPTFPFSISTYGGSTYGGPLVPQQVPQILSNSIYDHMVSQQLGNNTSSSAPQKQPKNSQVSFPSGSAQLQNQETLMPSQAVLSATGVSLQHPRQANEKNVTTDSRSAKKQLPIVQRNVYTQNFPAVHVTNINSTSALSMPSQDFSLMANFGGKQTGKTKQQAQAQVIPQQQLTAQAQKQQKAYLPTQYQGSELKEFDSKLSHSSLNRGPMHADLVGGLSGELLHSMVDLRGHGQSQKSNHNQTTSGQSHQYGMPAGHDQKMHQRKVTTSAGDSVRITNESLYPKVGLEWDSSRNVQGFQTNIDGKRGNTVNSTMITFSEGMTGQAVNVGKLSTGQGIHFPGQNATVASQGLRRSHSMQDSGHMKTTNIASAGSLLTSPSGTPTQTIQGAATKSQGQQLRSEQPTMNSRISPASMTSSASTCSTLPALQSVSKSGAGALTKNSTSVKDSHSSLQKSPVGSTAVKGISAANMASVMGPGQASTNVQTQISQNQYSIQQQQFQQLRHHPQTVQFMDSAQKHHGQPVLQNYPLVQNYSQQTNKHPSSQHLQFGQHILIHQPLQYEVGTQSQVHSQPMSQQLTLHHQQPLQQFQQPPRQTASLTQHHKHIQPVLTTPFSISTSGNLAHTIGTIDTGSALSIGLDVATTTANSTSEINVPCSSSKTSCNEGSALPHGHNGAVSSVQHVSSSNTISVSYPNSLSQPMPNSAAAEKLGEKTNQ